MPTPEQVCRLFLTNEGLLVPGALDECVRQLSRFEAPQAPGTAGRPRISENCGDPFVFQQVCRCPAPVIATVGCCCGCNGG